MKKAYTSELEYSDHFSGRCVYVKAKVNFLYDSEAKNLKFIKKEEFNDRFQNYLLAGVLLRLIEGLDKFHGGVLSVEYITHHGIDSSEDDFQRLGLNIGIYILANIRYDEEAARVR